MMKKSLLSLAVSFAVTCSGAAWAQGDAASLEQRIADLEKRLEKAEQIAGDADEQASAFEFHDMPARPAD